MRQSTLCQTLHQLSTRFQGAPDSRIVTRTEKNTYRRPAGVFLKDKIDQARSMYLPVRVSTLIFSPVLMKSGACTVIPVSSVTDFCTLFAESPRIPSGASVTFRTTL